VDNQTDTNAYRTTLHRTVHVEINQNNDWVTF